MAEFKEVMKQRKRMCNCTICENCWLSLLSNREHKTCMSFIIDCADKAEKIIMDWAKEHPIVTNKDKFKEVFGDAAASLIDLNECNIFDCRELVVSCDNCQFDNFWEKEYKEPKGENE